MAAGRLCLRGAAAVVAAVALSSALVVPAAASTQVGETFDPSGVLGGSGVTDLQTGSPGGQYTVPFGGVITSWSFEASAANVPDLKFKVGRSAGANDFLIVGEDGPRTPVPSMLNTFPTRIAVQAGDVIGDYRVTGGLFARSATNDYLVQTVPADPAPGTIATFTGPGPGLQLDLSASLEADCDGDGLGDETQDPDVSSCNPDTVAPETSITEHPSHRTKKKKATFEFTSSEPGSSFECAVDFEKLSPCASPLGLKAPKGKHNFRVRATDAAGNVDASPATFTWKVKKKPAK